MGLIDTSPIIKHPVADSPVLPAMAVPYFRLGLGYSLDDSDLSRGRGKMAQNPRSPRRA